jgi:hypothetical protein
MNIFEMVRRDEEKFRTLFEQVDERSSAGAWPVERGFLHLLGRKSDLTDFEESLLMHSFSADDAVREVPLEELDDCLAVDLWLKELGRG